MGRTTPKGTQPRKSKNAANATEAKPVSRRVKIVAIVAVLMMLLPIVLSVTTGGDDGANDRVRCRITEAGAELRGAVIVAADQLPTGSVGDTYESVLGCVPGDEEV